MTLKIATVIGARPQFIKSAVLSEHILHHYTDKLSETIIHSGQHFSPNMSDIFLNELAIKAPIVKLSFNAKRHGKMTADILCQFEKYLINNRPDYVLVYGDTNTTLAAALAAAKLLIPVLHVEAGLRSYNKNMPEEINRVLTDHVSQQLFCPTERAVTNLAKEGITQGVAMVGDVMYDLYLKKEVHIQNHSTILDKLKLQKKSFALATCHRAENTNHVEKLDKIFKSLEQLSKDFVVVLPLHPRTKKIIDEHGLVKQNSSIRFTPPLGYFDMLSLQKNARIIITDSGGIQKEAYFSKTPCLTLRDETEWEETLIDGWNTLVNVEKDDIMDNILKQINFDTTLTQHHYFGNGYAADKIINHILAHHHAG